MDEELKDEVVASSAEEQKNAISSDLIRGHINTIILRTLYERDKYGYEIIDEIEAKSHGQYSLKQPTLYSALKRLESQGYINAYWKTDEVSQGGRRKYYTLTESGKAITEKNQAEWEYSRTVIDNLISDKSFDFTQPPPTPVDFKILKNSTSRVPIVKDAESSNPYRIVNCDEPAENPTYSRNIYAEEENENSLSEEKSRLDSYEDVHTEMSEEQKRIVHENYLKLISEPVKVQEETPPAPYSETLDTEKLIYNNRPETERDYKNIINNLFAKTIKPKNQSVQFESNADRRARENFKYADAATKAEGDGLKIYTSEYEAAGSRRKKYNIGSSLFKSSLIIGVILLIETLLCYLFKNELEINLTYPLIILIINVAQIMIFSVLKLTGIGKNSRKPASLTVLSASVIVSVFAIVIICVISLLTNVNFTSVADILAKIAIPSVIVLNLPLFALCFHLFNK